LSLGPHVSLNGLDLAPLRKKIGCRAIMGPVPSHHSS
jgi:hypothetical protein